MRVRWCLLKEHFCVDEILVAVLAIWLLLGVADAD